MALEHEDLSLKDCLIGKRKMDSHLVTVEVSVERSTSKRMQLDSLTLNELWLESLNTETVKCRSTVQKYWVTLHHILKDIIDNRFTTVNDTLCRLNSLDDATLDELTDNEWLIELCCHKLWQTTFAHVKFWTYNDNGTCRIVNTLTEEVLTEATSLTLQRVRE